MPTSSWSVIDERQRAILDRCKTALQAVGELTGYAVVVVDRDHASLLSVVGSRSTQALGALLSGATEKLHLTLERTKTARPDDDVPGAGIPKLESRGNATQPVEARGTQSDELGATDQRQNDLLDQCATQIRALGVRAFALAALDHDGKTLLTTFGADTLEGLMVIMEHAPEKLALSMQQPVTGGDA